MIRTIVDIDEAKCNGCGLCVNACHEGALELVDGKAKLLRDDYCDGMGDCLPACPVDAISFIEREAAAYDEDAVLTARAKARTSELRNWPVQIKLAPTVAPYFDECDLLIAADCTAFAHAGFNAAFQRGKVTLIGCPKLDAIDYAEKLAVIIGENDVSSITVARMQVPCCGGIEAATRRALTASGKDLPIEVITLSTDGGIV